jgi:hypothetical protein
MNTVGREETLARGRGHEEVSRPATNTASIKQICHSFPLSPIFETSKKLLHSLCPSLDVDVMSNIKYKVRFTVP